MSRLISALTTAAVLTVSPINTQAASPETNQNNTRIYSISNADISSFNSNVLTTNSGSHSDCQKTKNIGLGVVKGSTGAHLLLSECSTQGGLPLGIEAKNDYQTFRTLQQYYVSSPAIDGKLMVHCTQDDREPLIVLTEGKVTGLDQTAANIVKKFRDITPRLCKNGEINSDAVVDALQAAFPQAFPKTIKRVHFTFNP